MHESEINDPLAEKLGRFTPDTTGLDRDALLFQAGQASVPARRLWPALAGLLALSQIATLVFFLTRSPEQLPPVVVVQPLIPEQKIEVPSAPGSMEPREWTYRRAWISGNIDDLPKQPTIEHAVAPERTLTVRSVSAVLDN